MAAKKTARSCNCVEGIDAALCKEKNSKLDLVFLMPNMRAYPRIATVQFLTGRGKPKAATLLPTFCPFCGKRYP